MNDPAGLIVTLTEQEIGVYETGGQMRLTGPAGSLTSSVLDQVRAQKGGILALLERWLCRYPEHRISDWRQPAGAWVCGVCHPPPFELCPACRARLEGGSCRRCAAAS